MFLLSILKCLVMIQFWAFFSDAS